MQDNKATQGLSKVACARSERINMTKPSTITGRDGAYYSRGSHIDRITAEFLDCTGVGSPGAEAEERLRGDADVQASVMD